MNDRHWYTDLIMLTALISLLFGIFLGSRPLSTPDEARYTEIPREMVVSGDYITPRLNYIKYFEKPAFFYWMQSASIKVFGVHEWSARLMTALFGLLGCLMLYIAGRKLFDRRTGWLAALILASSTLYYVMARFATIDMTLSSLVTGALLCFLLGNQAETGKVRNRWLWGMYIFSALATLTKGLIGVIFPGMIIFAWLLVCNRWRDLKTYCIPTGIALWLMITLPWHILVQLKNPEFFHFYVIEQQFLRYFTDYSHRSQPFWFLITTVLVGLLPWIAFIPQALKWNWPNWQQRHHSFQTQVVIFLLLWPAIIYLFFQFSHSQLIPYILPIFPPLVLLLARYFSHLWNYKGYQRGIWRGLLALGLLAILVCLAVLTIGMYFHAAIKPLKLHFIWIPAGLLVFTVIVALLNYWQRSIRGSILALLIGFSVILVTLNPLAQLTQANSIKPLAMAMLPYLSPNAQVLSYHGYLQDLPVYTQRRVIAVGWANQELEFGMAHQNMQGWLIDDATLWRHWQTNTPMFMIMPQKDYNELLSKSKLPLHLLAQTRKNVLVTNQSITP